MSLAHNGVLFLDELPEFASQALDSLRQPLETGEIIVARANHHVRYPARVQLVAAMNPCKCGHGGLGKGNCGKVPRCLQDYQGRVSGPLMDRIDLQIDVPPVTAVDLGLPTPAEGSAEVAARVAAARRIQAERAQRLNLSVGNALNATAHGEGLDTICALDDSAKALLTQAAQHSNLSARGWARTLRLARTIADLEQAPDVLRRHVAEALIYRRKGPIGERDGPRATISA
jgi:magnesium chelatase family protein